jgi:hypothetical protein
MLREASILGKDMFTIQHNLGDFNPSNIGNNDLNKSGLLLFLSKLNNKIPDLVKLFFKFLFGVLFIFKLFIFIFDIDLDITKTAVYFKYYLYIMGSLAFIYQFSNLYFLNKAINKNLKISEVLPQFLIN